ncbi:MULTISPECIES: fructose-6-phosphate aldolase [unclassified Bartonella]|uniref:fructose-6-phosphate aldolase n=1 Tax=Bartonella TaxID=773 RepID=UPI00099A6BD4|nr:MULTISPECIES: fructose-6-phosphate aldolase [unclassified Bartonella]AQX18938.1 transaldolase [Bartonella sp. A1379B]AQX22162.1 transaldolase [Bartonella sp. 11B]AQX24557.1 transaldolase [Bartonella sp. 114]AQX25930.1 transaldolase [Bartonella sp. Coyote22sub2]
MKFFVDSAHREDIQELQNLGLVDGVTTNPSLILKSGRNILETIKEICALVSGPVSAEVVATDFDNMMKEAAVLAKIANNICIKLPLTLDGLKACKALTEQGLKTNLTLCFSANQALLAAKAGATFISPFIGRIDDCGYNGIELLHEIRTLYDQYNFNTQILAASIRSVNHVKEAALSGADVATVPPAILKNLIKHPLTDQGLQTFAADWAKTGQSIA